MSDVKEELVIVADGEATRKFMTFHSDGWLLISDHNTRPSLDFSPTQVKELISFIQSSASKVSLPPDKRCPISPDGIHELETNRSQSCKWCGKVIW